ncbi:hypothetical protein SK128_008107 [Halocaridina rubra]|uniref:Condensation domain-containing protein n=1 Tax=Halocaridina rubra TaxID=373956 RepID=A0AAN9AFK4_HALRR
MLGGPSSIKSVFGLNKTAWSSGSRTLAASTKSRRYKSTKNYETERDNDGTFEYKMDEFQKLLIYGQRAKTRLLTPYFTLNSKKPLPSDVVQKAMQHVHRKCPTLHFTAKERDGELWWYKPHKMNLDFQVLEKEISMYDAIEIAQREGIDDANENWKVRFKQAAEDDPCLLPEVKREYPHQSYIMIIYNHACSDGITSSRVAQTYFDVINALIEGDTIHDDVPIGEYISNVEIERAYKIRKENILKDPKYLEEMKTEVTKAEKTPLLIRTFPRPEATTPVTMHQMLEMSKDIMLRFTENCKINGVTSGTGFQNIVNTALIELAQDGGAKEDYFDMSVNVPVDLRRYMTQRDMPILGAHTRPMTSFITMAKDVRDDFWKNCQEVQFINNNLLKSGAVIDQTLVKQLFFQGTPAHEFFNSLPALTKDYGYSNMGTFDKVITGHGKHVQVTGLEQYQSTQHFIYPFFVCYYKFRGNFYLEINYATDSVTEDTAQHLCDKIKFLIMKYSAK